jgi:hypothetical protein
VAHKLIFKSNHGFVALLVLAMVGVIGILGAGFVTGMSSISSRESQRATMRAGMDVILLKLQGVARGSYNFQQMTAYNSSAVDPTTAWTPCPACGNSLNAGFKGCFDTPVTCTPSGVAVLFSGDGTQVTGTRAAPLYYDVNGEICPVALTHADKLLAGCIFEVFTEYTELLLPVRYRIDYWIQVPDAGMIPPRPETFTEAELVASGLIAQQGRTGNFVVFKSFIINGTKMAANAE